MALQVTKSTETQYNPVFLKILEDMPGGVTLATGDLPSTTEEIRAGTMVGEGSTAGLYHVVKTAKLYTPLVTGGTSTVVVYANEEFVAGDTVWAEGGDTTQAISSITLSNSTYHTWTMAGKFGHTADTSAGLASGALIRLVTSGSTQKYTPEGLTRDDVDVTGDNNTVGVVVRGSVKEDVLPYFASSNDKSTLSLFRFV